VHEQHENRAEESSAPSCPSGNSRDIEKSSNPRPNTHIYGLAAAVDPNIAKAHASPMASAPGQLGECYDVFDAASFAASNN